MTLPVVCATLAGAPERIGAAVREVQRLGEMERARRMAIR